MEQRQFEEEGERLRMVRRRMLLSVVVAAAAFGGRRCVWSGTRGPGRGFPCLVII